MTDSLFIAFALTAIAGSAEWLSRFRFGRSLGGALISIILAAVLANSGVIPPASSNLPVYDITLGNAAALSIFLMLLEVRLAALKRAGADMLGAFLLGALATLVGVVISFYVTGIASTLGQHSSPLAGMYVATYIGGSANFNALALHYGLSNEANLFAGANAVDNVITALWIVLLLLIPAWVHRLRNTRPRRPAEADAPSATELSPQAAITLHSLAVLVALAFGGHWLSLRLAGLFAEFGFPIPSVLILTTLALIVAQLPAIHRLQGAQMLGTYGAYLFLAVIGAYCDFGVLIGMGGLALHLLAFVSIGVAIHGLILFGVGSKLGLEPELLSIASVANIGGSSTALPLARSLNRMDLLLPGILVGSLGTALGTYAGFATVWLLG